MNPNDLPQMDVGVVEPTADDMLSPLLQGPAMSLFDGGEPLEGPVRGVIIGTLLALSQEGRMPLVGFPGQPGVAAMRAASVVDLHGQHIGRGVVLMFEGGDVNKPIVMGVLRGDAGWPLAERPNTVEVDTDGQRMIVSASEQLVLRCGQASITLTKAGKVLIEGTYVSSHSSGVNRVQGGSVRLN
jgi:hypothetical protein